VECKDALFDFRLAVALHVLDHVVVVIQLHFKRANLFIDVLELTANGKVDVLIG
jgi:hypothetical protein